MTEPRRIVSLVPSDSYTLARLGVADRLVGRTSYCIAPPEIAGVETVGGTKNADTERIIALAPDLVVANQEENRKIDIERLEAAGVPVLLSFPKTVADGLAHAERLAALFPSVDNDLGWARAALARPVSADPVPTFVPIWMDPLMTIHGDTFISDALRLAGADNVFAARRGDRLDTRYPRIALDEVVARRPRLVLLPDEPHAFSEADADVFRALPIEAQIRFCDGKDLMWYGLRSIEGLAGIAQLVDDCRAM